MSKKTNIHAGIMLILSLIFALISMSFIESQDLSSSYGVGYLIGRAFGLTLLPLIIIIIPTGIYKLIKRSNMPGFYIVWWILWFILAVLSTIGIMIQTPAS